MAYNLESWSALNRSELYARSSMSMDLRAVMSLEWKSARSS